MTHPLIRPVELILGVVVLLSVASVPVPRKANVTPLSPLPAGYTERVETLQRHTQSQAQNVAALTEETRQLSELLRVQQQSEMAHPPRPHRAVRRSGIVAPHEPTQSDPTLSVGVQRLATPPVSGSGM